MGTRMNVEIRAHPEAKDQETLWIYRHWDGYPLIEGNFNPETKQFEKLDTPELSSVGFDLSRLFTAMKAQDWPMSPKRIGDWIIYMGAEDIAIQRHQELQGEKPLSLIDSYRWNKPSHYEWTTAQHGDIDWLYTVGYDIQGTPYVFGKCLYDPDLSWSAIDYTFQAEAQLNARDERAGV